MPADAPSNPRQSINTNDVFNPVSIPTHRHDVLPQISNPQLSKQLIVRRGSWLLCCARLVASREQQNPLPRPWHTEQSSLPSRTRNSRIRFPLMGWRGLNVLFCWWSRHHQNVTFDVSGVSMSILVVLASFGAEGYCYFWGAAFPRLVGFSIDSGIFCVWCILLFFLSRLLGRILSLVCSFGV